MFQKLLIHSNKKKNSWQWHMSLGVYIIKCILLSLYFSLSVGLLEGQLSRAPVITAISMPLVGCYYAVSLGWHFAPCYYRCPDVTGRVGRACVCFGVCVSGFNALLSLSDLLTLSLSVHLYHPSLAFIFLIH